MARLWRRWRGYVIIKVKGPQLEQFLNHLTAAGLRVREVIRPSPHMLVATVSVNGFKKLKYPVRKGRWRVTILQKKGLPFALQAWWRRKMLIVGALMTGIALYIASGFVWFIDVRVDVPTVDAHNILAVAEQGGLIRGVRHDAVDVHGLQKLLLLEIPELAWASVDVRGVKATIEATERSGVSSATRAPGDVIAARDGVIVHVAAFMGTPLVKPEDTVSKGDVLISGFVADDDAAMASDGYVRADGVVQARTWYEGEATVALVASEADPTGDVSKGWTLTIGGRVWRWGRQQPSFDDFLDDSRSWSWRLKDFYVGLERHAFRQVHRRFHVVDRSEAESIAEELALAALTAQLPVVFETSVPDVEWARETVERRGVPSLRVTARLEKTETISVYRSYDDPALLEGPTVSEAMAGP